MEELRRRRRSTANKAETAEKKLAKMGPENKGLPGQTELLERLRVEMRQLDHDIVTEESRLGDFKRQMMKEALSYKFGGLEELGEKMCIIGELGKLLIEEIPLEETPPGYGRAPYTGYDKTENAVNEANKCLATVKFASGSANPKPPGIPPPSFGTPQHLSAAEEFGHYPTPSSPGGGNVPDRRQVDQQGPRGGQGGQGGQYSLDAADPYGGIANPYVGQNSLYGEYGGTRDSRYPTMGGPPRDERYPPVPGPAGEEGQVVWQGPTEEALRAHTQAVGEAQPRGYDFQQPQPMDVWRDQANGNGPSQQAQPSQLAQPVPGPSQGQENEKKIPRVPVVHAPTPETERDDQPAPAPFPHDSMGSSSQSIPQPPPGAAPAASHLQRPWEPLNIKRDRAASPNSISLRDGPSGASPRTSSEGRVQQVSQMPPVSQMPGSQARTQSYGSPNPNPQSYGGNTNTDVEDRDPYAIPAPPGESNQGFYTPVGGTPEPTNGGFTPYHTPNGAPPQSAPNFSAPPQIPAARPDRPASPIGPSRLSNEIASKDDFRPPPPAAQMRSSSPRPMSPGGYTPTAGKISAGAFQRKPRTSGTGDGDMGGPSSPLSPSSATRTPGNLAASFGQATNARPSGGPISEQYHSAGQGGYDGQAGYAGIQAQGSGPDAPPRPNYAARPSTPSQGRRLPMPPNGQPSARPETPLEASFALPQSPDLSLRNPMTGGLVGKIDGRSRLSGGHESFGDVAGDVNPPPGYGHEDSLR